MSKIELKFLDKLSAEETSRLHDSPLFFEMEASYWDSESEERFATAYERSANGASKPFNPVFFIDGKPVWTFRAQIRDGKLSYWSRPIRIHRLDDLNMEAIRVIHTGVENALFENGVGSARFFHDELTLSSYWELRINTTTVTRGIVNLKRPESEITGSLRKSYRSLVNWGKRSMSVEDFDHKTLSEPTIEEFRQFHIKVAGRETRSRETWETQGRLIKEKRGFVVMGRLSGSLVSAVMVLHGHREAVYGVAVNDRERMAGKEPVGHWPLLRAIQLSAERGLARFDMGIIEGVPMNEKELNISKFKKGFCERLMSEPVHEFSFRKETDGASSSN